MRWSIIRIIWLREMRDQLRDRRTLFMILGLPLLLYPILGAVVLQFAHGFSEEPSIIGVVTGSPPHKDFPPRTPPFAGRSLAGPLAWLSATPMPGADVAQWGGACTLSHVDHVILDYPLLISQGQITSLERRSPRNLG